MLPAEPLVFTLLRPQIDQLHYRGLTAPFVLLTIGQSVVLMDRHYERPLPETITTILDDGCIAISVGDFTGVVSSMHLIEPKAHQLQSAWLAREAELSDAR